MRRIEINTFLRNYPYVLGVSEEFDAIQSKNRKEKETGELSREQEQRQQQRYQQQYKSRIPTNPYL